MARKDVNTTHVNVTLSRKLLEEIDAVCDDLGCPRSTFIALACREKINNQKMVNDTPALMNQMVEVMKFLQQNRVDYDASDVLNVDAADALKKSLGSAGSGVGGDGAAGGAGA